jgi:hypothetical protein
VRIRLITDLTTMTKSWLIPLSIGLLLALQIPRLAYSGR